MRAREWVLIFDALWGYENVQDYSV